MWDDPSPSLIKPSLKLAKLDPLRWTSGSPLNLIQTFDVLVAQPPPKHAKSGVFLKGVPDLNQLVVGSAAICNGGSGKIGVLARNRAKKFHRESRCFEVFLGLNLNDHDRFRLCAGSK